MWKLLIVEDEPLVRRTIIQKVNWKEHGFEIVGEAENGRDALRIITDKQPDLVISDIVMPLMDGIELLKVARSTGWAGRFLMLTCMNEFEYAQQALEHGASGYILKLSMDMKALEAALHKVKLELAESNMVAAALTMSRGMQFVQTIWDSLYSDTDSKALDNDFWIEMSTELGEHVWMCSFVHDSQDYCMNEVKRLGLLNLVNHSLLAFAETGITTVFAWSKVPIKWKTADLAGLKLPYPAVVTVTRNDDKLRNKWFEALCQLDNHWYAGNTGIYYSKQVSTIKKQEKSMPWFLEKELLRLVEQNKVEQCLPIVEQMWQVMRECHYPVSMVYTAIHQLDRIVARIVDHPDLPLQELRLSSSSQSFMELFINRLRTYTHHQSMKEERLTNHEEINKILRYIHEHYNTNLTLKSLAKYVSMEEHYISRLFKQKTGDNLINYVHKYRIEKAKIYLKETGLSVSEISWSVGFANDNYFIKIFKRFTGMTPSVFRYQN